MPVATAKDVSALLDRITKLEDALKITVEAADRMFSMRGKGIVPSWRLQEAFDRSRELVPTITPQACPRSED